MAGRYGRGRRRKDSYLIYFDYSNYLRDVEKILKEHVVEIQTQLTEVIRRNLEAIEFKDNPVKMADGRITSDSERKEALINSIVSDRVKRIQLDVYEGIVSAMQENFKDSHIGIYYEWGTGTKVDQSANIDWFSLGDYNPDRSTAPGAEIVPRGKMNKDFEGPEPWRDAGGNIRLTSRKYGGFRDEKEKEAFREYVGDDLQPYHWFRNAVEEISMKLKEELLAKIAESINPLKYLKMRSEFTLGLD